MAEMDRRGFLRGLRRTDNEEKTEEAAAPAPLPPEVLQLIDLTASLLRDLDDEEEEQLAEGPLLTGAYDQAYMRVTTGHIVASFATGFSVSMRTGDVKTFDPGPVV
jgi:hypothetical protein